MTRKKIILGGIALLVIAVGVAALIYKREIGRLAYAVTLFTGEEQYENFNRMKELFPHTTMEAAETPYVFPEGEGAALPASFTYEGETFETDAFLKETDTGALFILQDGKLQFEDYWLTGGPDVNWLSMSVAKSFISAAIGIAVEEGHIKSIEEPVTDYVPALKGSAYDGVRIKDVLQMSSGARWNEDYSDPDADINRFGRIMAVGGSFNEFAATLQQEREPGTYNHYNSIDTQVLGMLLTEATGRSITEYMEEKLWQPLGMQDEAYWMVDDDQMEMAFGGLNATARDYAKLGELYRKGGVWQGEEIVPADWVRASVTPDAPYLMPGAKPDDPFNLGYGYQWWLPESDEREFLAIGIYNQFIYVNPARGIVIVKLSAFSNYATSHTAEAYRELETIEFFRAIAASLTEGPNS